MNEEDKKKLKVNLCCECGKHADNLIPLSELGREVKIKVSLPANRQFVCQECWEHIKKAAYEPKKPPPNSFCCECGEHTDNLIPLSELGPEVKIKVSLPTNRQFVCQKCWQRMKKAAVGDQTMSSAPIWNSTTKYLGYGVIAGITLKAIDTSIMMFSINTWLGIVWLIVAASVLISKKISWAPVVAIIISFTTGITVNLFVTLLVVCLVGAIFGAPFGMIVGTVVGYFRRAHVRIAPDAKPEGWRPWLLGFIIPLFILAILVPVYIWFNVHLLEWMQG